LIGGVTDDEAMRLPEGLRDVRAMQGEKRWLKPYPQDGRASRWFSGRAGPGVAVPGIAALFRGSDDEAMRPPEGLRDVRAMQGGWLIQA
jgi:hypothetical protein